MMLAAEQQYVKTKTYDLEKEINRLHNQQMAIKIQYALDLGVSIR